MYGFLVVTQVERPITMYNAGVSTYAQPALLGHSHNKIALRGFHTIPKAYICITRLSPPLPPSADVPLYINTYIRQRIYIYVYGCRSDLTIERLTMFSSSSPSSSRVGLAVLALLSLALGVMADGGDDFTNNLFSDLAPYATLLFLGLAFGGANTELATAIQLESQLC